MALLHRSGVPAIASPLDSYSIASRINSMTIKTLPGDVEKIERIQSVVEKFVEVERIAAAINGIPTTEPVPQSDLPVG
jgi:BioD-like phosphotransacetylase family protein